MPCSPPGIPHGWLCASWSKTHLLPLLPNFPPTSARAGVSQEPAQKLSLGFLVGAQLGLAGAEHPAHSPRAWPLPPELQPRSALHSLEAKQETIQSKFLENN